MKTTSALSASIFCASWALASSMFATSAHADDTINKQTLETKDMSMKDCQKHMKMSKKHTGEKDDTMKMHDAHCASMMKEHRGMNKGHPPGGDSMMKRDAPPSDPMMK